MNIGLEGHQVVG